MRVHTGAGKPTYVQAMFDGIARRYDVMNRLMTGGFDGVARRMTARSVSGPDVRVAIDMGCGTGDLSFALAREVPGATVVGLDFSAGMLAEAARKLVEETARGRGNRAGNGSDQGLGPPTNGPASKSADDIGPRVPLVRGDGMALAVRDASADALVSAWVLRNVADVSGAFQEAKRVLAPGGRAAFLELTPVQSAIFGPIFRAYFYGIVPWVGARLSGHAAAYTYLPESVDRFPTAEALAQLMERAGFERVRFRRLAFGTLALHTGTAPQSIGGGPVSLTRRWPSRAEDWDASVALIPGAHSLQSWAWGEFRRATGWEVERVIWEREGVPVAAAQVLRRRLPVPGLGVAYVPKGPVVHAAYPEVWPVVLRHLAEFARERRCVFVKVDPDVVHGDATVLAALRRAGFARSRHQIQYPATMVVDLEADDVTMFSRLRQTWRRYVRKAEREGVSTGVTAAPTLPEVEAFVALYRETAQRDGFVLRDDGYYREALRTLCAAGLATLHLARVADEVVAAAVVLQFGDRAWYLWGATSARGLETHAMYRLQWEAMRYARDQGASVYDMWGAPEDLEDEADPLRGVAWFKSGYGARHIRWIGAWDAAPWPAVYRAWLVTLPHVVGLLRRMRGESTGHTVVARAE